MGLSGVRHLQAPQQPASPAFFLLGTLHLCLKILGFPSVYALGPPLGRGLSLCHFCSFSAGLRVIITKHPVTAPPGPPPAPPPTPHQPPHWPRPPPAWLSAVLLWSVASRCCPLLTLRASVLAPLAAARPGLPPPGPAGHWVTMSIFRGTGCTYGAGAQAFGLKLRLGWLTRPSGEKGVFSSRPGRAVRTVPAAAGR